MRASSPDRVVCLYVPCMRRAQRSEVIGERFLQNKYTRKKERERKKREKEFLFFSKSRAYYRPERESDEIIIALQKEKISAHNTVYHL